jgi:hypothetical protein
MKKILQLNLGIVALAAILTFQSCNKLSSIVKTPDVSFTGASTDVVIPPTSDTTAQAAIGQTAFSYNIDSMIKSQTGGVVGFSSISTIKIKNITLTLTDATPTNNFANFVYAGGEFNTYAPYTGTGNVNGYYPAYNIAYIQNNPDSYSNTISPPVIDATQDVKKYFSSNTTFVYLIVAKLRRPITQTLHCHIDITYDIAF